MSDKHKPDQEQEHEHGTMDVSVQEVTFEGFVRWVTWGAAIIIVSLVLLALVNG
ncbi:MAG: aa3-type cytochrome c oxidase subunit IV [Pseudomonadota bacterium]